MRNGIVVEDASRQSKIGFLRFGYCPAPVVVAVGGGGQGSNGGGGSGYVEYAEVLITQSYTEFMASVGEGGYNSGSTAIDGSYSFVTDLSHGNVTVVSAEGGHAASFDGGAGYSGGGGYDSIGYGGGWGGTDGSEGRNGTYVGGVGSGFDVSTIPTKSVELTPGDGGFGDNSPGGGGGGGGLMVNGQGPDDDYHDGQGYGGGGTSYKGDGIDGVIIFD